VTILDAYAVLAFLKDEAAASEVERIIATGDAALTALGVAEVLDHLIRLGGANEEEASLDLAELDLSPAMAVDDGIASSAGRLRARRYHRTACPVSLADCVAAEVARAEQRPLATSDPSLLDVCHEEGVDYLVLSGSDGSRWSPPQRN